LPLPGDLPALAGLLRMSRRGAARRDPHPPYSHPVHHGPDSGPETASAGSPQCLVGGTRPAWTGAVSGPAGGREGMSFSDHRSRLRMLGRSVCAASRRPCLPSRLLRLRQAVRRRLAGVYRRPGLALSATGGKFLTRCRNPTSPTRQRVNRPFPPEFTRSPIGLVSAALSPSSASPWVNLHAPIAYRRRGPRFSKKMSHKRKFAQKPPAFC
jgi:hypothetical protein